MTEADAQAARAIEELFGQDTTLDGLYEAAFADATALFDANHPSEQQTKRFHEGEYAKSDHRGGPQFGYLEDFWVEWLVYASASIGLYVWLGVPRAPAWFSTVAVLSVLFASPAFVSARMKHEFNRHGRIHCLGPLSRRCHRRWVAWVRRNPPQRVDAHSREGMKAVLAHLRGRYAGERQSVHGRIVAAQHANALATKTASELRDRTSRSASQAAEGMFASSRLEALDRVLARHVAVKADLDAQERRLKAATDPIVAQIDALSSQLDLGASIEEIVDADDRVALLEEEARGIEDAVREVCLRMGRSQGEIGAIAAQLAAARDADAELGEAVLEARA